VRSGRSRATWELGLTAGERTRDPCGLIRATARKHIDQWERVRMTVAADTVRSFEICDRVSCLARSGTETPGSAGHSFWFARCCHQVTCAPALHDIFISEPLGRPALRLLLVDPNQCAPGLRPVVRTERQAMAPPGTHVRRPRTGLHRTHRLPAHLGKPRHQPRNAIAGPRPAWATPLPQEENKMERTVQ
jgi:hypothetical protein